MNYVGATRCVVGECMFRQTSADGRYIGGRLFMTCTIVCTKWLTHQDLYFSVVYSMSVCGGLFGSFTMKMDKILLFYNKNWVVSDLFTFCWYYDGLSVFKELLSYNWYSHYLRCPQNRSYKKIKMSELFLSLNRFCQHHSQINFSVIYYHDLEL